MIIREIKGHKELIKIRCSKCYGIWMICFQIFVPVVFESEFYEFVSFLIFWMGHRWKFKDVNFKS